MRELSLRCDNHELQLPTSTYGGDCMYDEILLMYSGHDDVTLCPSSYFDVVA